jgi:hypothetical protein
MATDMLCIFALPIGEPDARSAGKAAAFNDLHDLDTSDADEHKWHKIVTTNPPPPRSKHAAIAVRAIELVAMHLNVHQT